MVDEPEVQTGYRMHDRKFSGWGGGGMIRANPPFLGGDEIPFIPQTAF